MRINEVTIFKLMFFVVCVVFITILATKLVTFNKSSEKGTQCELLMVEDVVKASIISQTCPEEYFQNFGKFEDVPDAFKCCVQYEVLS